MKKLGLLIIMSAILIASCKNTEEIKIISYNDSLSYAIGNDIAKNFERSDLDSLNIDVLAKSIKDHFAKDISVMDSVAISDVLMKFSQKMRAEQEAKMLEQNKTRFKAELDAGQSYLAENAKKEGVITTESGLQYKIVKDGTGATPTAADKVSVHYEGTLIDGTKFDSSYDRKEPIEFVVTGVIPGWTEALQLMKEGSEYELCIPYNLAYGERGSGSIKPFSTLIFKVELLKIVK